MPRARRSSRPGRAVRHRVPVLAPSPDPRHLDLADELDLAAIGRLQARYGDAVTRRDRAEMASLFAPGAIVRLDLRTGSIIELRGGDEVADFVEQALARFELFLFTLLNATAELDPADPDRASGRVLLREVRQEPAPGGFTEAYGLYHDRYVRLDGRWRIAGRSYHSLARTPAERRDDRLEVFGIPSGDDL